MEVRSHVHCHWTIVTFMGCHGGTDPQTGVGPTEIRSHVHCHWMIVTFMGCHGGTEPQTGVEPMEVRSHVHCLDDCYFHGMS